MRFGRDEGGKKAGLNYHTYTCYIHIHAYIIHIHKSTSHIILSLCFQVTFLILVLKEKDLGPLNSTTQPQHIRLKTRSRGTLRRKTGVTG